MTSTDKTDLIEGFRANRFQQIANLSERAAELEAAVARGELRKIANGRFSVVSGWDKGEILSDQGMPESGLDVQANGVAAFYSNSQPAWHELGTVIPGGLTDIDAVLRASGLDWSVVPRKIRFFEDEKAETGLHAGDDSMKVMVRDDTWAALGPVGSIFQPWQNRAGFEFLQKLAGDGIPFETAGSFRGGRRTFITMEIPEGITIDAEGINENLKMYLAAVNFHDGQGKIKLRATPWRIECENTERLGLLEAVTEWDVRHTKNMEVKLGEAERALKLTHNYMAAFAKEETKLVHTTITDADIAAIIADVWAVDESKKDSTRTVNNMEARVADIMERWTVERERCGRNAYAFERALTGHVDHATKLRPRGELKTQTPLAALGQAILEGTGDEKKTKAHRRVMALVRK